MIFKTAANALHYGWLRARLHHHAIQNEGNTGQGMVEYALILVLVAVVVIVVLTLLGPAIGNVFSEINCTAILEPQDIDCETFYG